MTVTSTFSEFLTDIQCFQIQVVPQRWNDDDKTEQLCYNIFSLPVICRSLTPLLKAAAWNNSIHYFTLLWHFTQPEKVNIMVWIVSVLNIYHSCLVLLVNIRYISSVVSNFIKHFVILMCSYEIIQLPALDLVLLSVRCSLCPYFQNTKVRRRT